MDRGNILWVRSANSARIATALGTASIAATRVKQEGLASLRDLLENATVNLTKLQHVARGLMRRVLSQN